ncbi:MAG: hypothetical protein ACXWKM_09640, partial [Phenylobacterium sp.]
HIVVVGLIPTGIGLVSVSVAGLAISFYAAHGARAGRLHPPSVLLELFALMTAGFSAGAGLVYRELLRRARKHPNP